MIKKRNRKIARHKHVTNFALKNNYLKKFFVHLSSTQHFKKHSPIQLAWLASTGIIDVGDVNWGIAHAENPKINPVFIGPIFAINAAIICRKAFPLSALSFVGFMIPFEIVFTIDGRFTFSPIKEILCCCFLFFQHKKDNFIYFFASKICVKSIKNLKLIIFIFIQFINCVFHFRITFALICSFWKKYSTTLE